MEEGRVNGQERKRERERERKREREREKEKEKERDASFHALFNSTYPRTAPTVSNLTQHFDIKEAQGNQTCLGLILKQDEIELSIYKNSSSYTAEIHLRYSPFLLSTSDLQPSLPLLFSFLLFFFFFFFFFCFFFPSFSSSFSSSSFSSSSFFLLFATLPAHLKYLRS